MSAFLLALTAGSCGGSPASPTPPTPPPPTQGAEPRPALSISCPLNASVISTTGTAVRVSFDVATASGGVPPVQVGCTRESGSPFEAGSTIVQCTASDSAGQSRSCTFTVTVTTPSPRLSGTRFLAFGDSLTAGEVALSPSTLDDPRSEVPNFRLAVVPSAAYPTQLAGLLRSRYLTQASSIDVINGGWPGEYLEAAPLRLTGLLANLRPEVVLLLHGYSDLAALGEPGVQPAARALDRLAKDARLRGARVLLATLPPPRPTGAKAVSTELVTALNGWIRSIAAGEGAVLVDLYPALMSDLTRYIGIDGLHPTEAGYRRMAEVFLEAIQANLELR